MRIATSQMFDAPMARMSSITVQADKLQTQISTGSRIQTASDDSAAWTKLQSLTRANSNDAAWSSNIKMAQTTLAQSNSTLGSVQTQLQRVQELTLQAQSGTLNDTDRAAIASELGQITDQLMNLANSKDVRGQPLFGGATGDTAYTKAADGTIRYASSGEQPAIPTGDNSSVAPGVTGERAFGDMFATIKAIADAVSSGQAPAADAGNKLTAIGNSISAARASVGARATQVDMEADQITAAKTDRADAEEKLGSTDIPTTVAQLQKMLTVLQATQSSFAKLSSLSVMNYIT